MRCKWMVGLGATLGLCVGSGFAGEIQWRPTAQPAPIASSVEAAAPRSPAASLGVPVPAAALGEPMPFGKLQAQTPTGQQPADPCIATVSCASFPSTDAPTTVRAQAPPDVPPPPNEAPPFPDTGVVAEPSGGTWLGNGYQHFIGGVTGIFQTNGERHPFQSDHCEDGFISPVSSPFLFEDPRALTEVRPIFLLQGTPSKSAGHGGDIEFLGLQARLAVSDQIDIVISKLGWIWEDAHNNPAIPPHSGFAEFDFGPKFTFLRKEETVAAAGLTFQIPAGAARVYQDTGSLSLVPYFTVAQNFGRTSYGSFNAMGTMAYAASVDSERSDYLYTGLHLDFNVANANKIYPLVELNWTHYTTGGNNAATSGFEGGDLFNLGSDHISGHNNLTVAFGARYKFSEAMQLGSTFEFPLVGTK